MTAAPRWLTFGEDAVLFEFTDPSQRWELHAPDGVELVVGATTVLARFDPARTTAAGVAAAVALRSPGPADRSRHHVIDVRYDGPDLLAVARAAQVAPGELVDRHAAGTYTAEFCGFAPGFAYLSGLDPALHLPRRAEPRTVVPPGSVAIAAGLCAVYPTSSPGGWHLIGRTDVTLFDARRGSPALIAPGDTVSFRPLP